MSSQSKDQNCVLVQPQISSCFCVCSGCHVEHNDLSRSSPLGTAAKATAVPGSLQRPLCRTHVVHRRSGCRCTPSQTPRRANMAVRGISFTGSEWPRSLSRWKDPTGRPLRPQLSELHPLSGSSQTRGGVFMSLLRKTSTSSPPEARLDLLPSASSAWSFAPRWLGPGSSYNNSDKDYTAAKGSTFAEPQAMAIRPRLAFGHSRPHPSASLYSTETEIEIPPSESFPFLSR